jgi:hypothetical protein
LSAYTSAVKKEEAVINTDKEEAVINTDRASCVRACAPTRVLGSANDALGTIFPGLMGVLGRRTRRVSLGAAAEGEVVFILHPNKLGKLGRQFMIMRAFRWPLISSIVSGSPPGGQGASAARSRARVPGVALGRRVAGSRRMRNGVADEVKKILGTGGAVWFADEVKKILGTGGAVWFADEVKKILGTGGAVWSEPNQNPVRGIVRPPVTG